MTTQRVGYALLIVLALVAPTFAYPVFLMKALCFALFACAFNLLLGYAGLMSFGHAMFFGMAGYFYGHVVKSWDMAPELGLLAGVAGAALLGLVTGALAIARPVAAVPASVRSEAELPPTVPEPPPPQPTIAVSTAQARVK